MLGNLIEFVAEPPFVARMRYRAVSVPGGSGECLEVVAQIGMALSHDPVLDLGFDSELDD